MSGPLDQERLAVLRGAAGPRVAHLSIVVPCYNEEEVLSQAGERLVAVLDRLARDGRISEHSKIWFVDDGSEDRTWEVIERLVHQDRRFSGIRLSRNRGHQNALLAGLFTATGDAVISIDADLQDDVGAIDAMLAEFENGVDVVYGVRKRRESDSFFKRASAETFYRLLNAMGAESVFNHADYRLMSRRALEELKTFREVNLFLRGIVPLLGFRSSVVYYDRSERFAGESKYPLRKMIALALDGVTSFSVTPLRLITLIGFVIFAATIAVSFWALWIRFFTDNAVPGWTSIVLPIYFLGGLMILCIGVIGEYLGKIYAEVKARPRYIIDKII